MLYYYCNRRIPGYFNQNLQNTVDDYLQLHLLQYLNPDEVPVVVFSNYPPNWFDATDGVPNVMRYYLIAEYIFANYRPLGIINKKSIWGKKESNYSWDFQEIDTLVSQTKLFDYKKAAYYTGEYYKHHKQNYLEQAFSWDAPDEYLFSPLVIELPVETIHNNSYIELIVDSEKDFAGIQLHLFSQDNRIGSFSFDAVRGGQKHYFLRPGNHYRWFTLKADKLELEIPHGFWIKQINILKDTRIENSHTDIY
jgi:hypothetical protein